jgi:hypothetical protein
MRFILSSVLAAALPLAAGPSYFKDIRPVLQKQCQGCHQPASKMADLDLTTYEGLAKGGKRGAPFAAGKPEESVLVQYLTGKIQPRMPLGQPGLPGETIEAFRQWIAEGAVNDTPAETSDAGPPVYLQLPVVTALAWSPDGTMLAVAGNREVLVHSPDGRQLRQRLIGGAERLLSLAFSADSKVLVAGGVTPAQFGEVQVWDPRAGKLLRSARVCADTVFGASLAPDSSRIAVGCADNTVHVFDTATAKELYKIGNHENWILDTVFGIDSKRFVTVSRDRAAKLVDAASGAFLENINLLRDELTAVARHPKKDVVVIGGVDRYPYIYLMDRPRNMRIADDTTLVKKLDRQEGAISALAWSPDGARIAVAGAAPSVNLYDAETGKLAASCKGHSAGIYALAFSPDAAQLATAGFDGMVRVYKTADCTLAHSFAPVPLSAGNPQTGGAL